MEGCYLRHDVVPFEEAVDVEFKGHRDKKVKISIVTKKLGILSITDGNRSFFTSHVTDKIGPFGRFLCRQYSLLQCLLYCVRQANQISQEEQMHTQQADHCV